MFELDDVSASYHRCRSEGDFIGTFYELFLGKSSDVASHFVSTDFARQNLMLRESVLELLCFRLGMSGTREEIERLGRRHRELAIPIAMYSLWLDALCEAVQKHDPEYTPELGQHWREAMRPGIDVMISASASPPDDNSQCSDAEWSDAE